MRTDLTADDFRARLAATGLRAVSFDVFDTVLVRSFARPHDLFHELGRRLAVRHLVTLPPERFSALRIQAEADARRHRADAEPNLGEIYAALAPRLDWSETETLLATRAELLLELESLSAVPRLRQWIEAARALGLRIAFVSDMYLPSVFIRDILAAQSLTEPEDAVLVSCEHRVSKSAGGLFDRLLDTLALTPAEILHVGDHAHSDDAVPRARGFAVQPVRDNQLSFLERSLLAYQHDTSHLAGRLAAAARRARLARSLDGTEPALAEIGAGLLGPWLASFALWTFSRARRAGIRRLYFVSRDGQVMRELALAVQRRWPDAAGIECRYLHGSRISWHHAAMTEIGDHQLGWLLNPQPVVNASVLADRLGLPLAEVSAWLSASPAAGLIGHSSWNTAEAACVAAALRGKSSEIVAHPVVVRRRDLALDYFKQEGLLRDTDWAVVELGWSGSMMVSLHAALGRPARLDAFYLNLSSFSRDLPAGVCLRSFAINPDDVSFHLGEGLRYAEMIEVLTAADHGTVLGYTEKDGRVIPMLKTDSAPIWPPAALRALRSGAVEFVAMLPPDVLAELSRQLGQEGSARMLAHQLLVVLTDFLRTPPADLARVFTACRFTEDPADRHQRAFVRPLRFWPVLQSGWETGRELWAEGSLACSPVLVAALARGGLAAAALQCWHGLRRRTRAAVSHAA
jgi:FMN phosphatase YigB (HAD superfamily)